jgi:hypothetical protein
MWKKGKMWKNFISGNYRKSILEEGTMTRRMRYVVACTNEPEVLLVLCHSFVSYLDGCSIVFASWCAWTVVANT